MVIFLVGDIFQINSYHDNIHDKFVAAVYTRAKYLKDVKKMIGFVPSIMGKKLLLAIKYDNYPYEAIVKEKILLNNQFIYNMKIVGSGFGGGCPVDDCESDNRPIDQMEAAYKGWDED